MKEEKMERKDYLYEVAKVIDNNFIGTKETFTCDKVKDHYILNSNQCDWASIIRVYFDENGLTKITRVGDDTDGYQEVHPETYKRVRQIKEKAWLINLKHSLLK